MPKDVRANNRGVIAVRLQRKPKVRPDVTGLRDEFEVMLKETQPDLCALQTAAALKRARFAARDLVPADPEVHGFPCRATRRNGDAIAVLQAYLAGADDGSRGHVRPRRVCRGVASRVISV